MSAITPYVLRDSGSIRGLSHWLKWDQGCPRAAVLAERDKLAESELEDDVSASPAPAEGAKTEVKDNAAAIGILVHAMLDYWMRRLVDKPSDTPFAPHKHATERHLYVAGAVADNFAKQLAYGASNFTECPHPQGLLGELVGTEVDISADRSLWGGEDAMLHLGLTDEEKATPLTGIADLITYLSPEHASRLNMALLRTDIQPGLTIWDYKTMDYLGNSPRHTGGYQHHAYSLMVGDRYEDMPLKEGEGPMGYPANFIYICMERGKGIKPKLSPALFIRKGTPIEREDFELTSELVRRAALKRSQHFSSVDLSRCEVSSMGFMVPCRYGPKGRAICTQRPGLEVVSG